MTDEQWQMLAPFAVADSKARQAYEAMRAMNVPTDPRKRIEADMYFERVRIEMQQTSQALEAARKRIFDVAMMTQSRTLSGYAPSHPDTGIEWHSASIKMPQLTMADREAGWRIVPVTITVAASVVVEQTMERNAA